MRPRFASGPRALASLGMPTLDLSSPLVALWSAAVVGFLVGVAPIGLAEVLAIAIGVVEPPRLALAMLVVFTVAHVAAKVLWYWIGAFADRVRHPRSQELIAKARALISRHPAYGSGVLAASAVFSVPPFHLAAIASGIVRIPFGRFFAVCLAGRAIRFGVLAAAPMLVRALFN